MNAFRTLLIMFVVVFVAGQAGAQIAGNTDSSRIRRTASGGIQKKYYFVMLTKGVRRNEQKDTAAINAIERGHLDNIRRLTQAGKLVATGPFGDDGKWLAVFIFDCNDEAEVKQLLTTDPAIATGRFAYEIHPWWTQLGTVFR